jgi:hypothetical protein
VGTWSALKELMREKYYRLLREYLTMVQERDLCEEQVRVTPEGVERECLSRKLDSACKRYATLRREIRNYPDSNLLPYSGSAK